MCILVSFLMVSFIYQLFVRLILNTASALCGLHLQPFKLSPCEPTSSAAMCHFLLKNVVIKDSYGKIASNKVAVHFTFTKERGKRTITHGRVWIIMNVKFCIQCRRLLMVPKVFSSAGLHLCSLTWWKWFDHLLIPLSKQDHGSASGRIFSKNRFTSKTVICPVC